MCHGAGTSVNILTARGVVVGEAKAVAKIYTCGAAKEAPKNIGIGDAGKNGRSLLIKTRYIYIYSLKKRLQCSISGHCCSLLFAKEDSLQVCNCVVVALLREWMRLARILVESMNGSFDKSGFDIEPELGQSGAHLLPFFP